MTRFVMYQHHKKARDIGANLSVRRRYLSDAAL
jgi:hypothetical protein